MNRFKKILYFVGDPSDPQPGLTEAKELARRNHAELTLLDVLPASSGGLRLSLPGKADLEKLVAATRMKALEEMVAPIEGNGFRVRAEVTTGSPFVEIIRRVVTEGYDLVMKTAKGVESRLGGLLGTTALHLMRKCPVPVWVVKPSAGPRFRRVLAAVDPDAEKPGAQELGVRVIEHAASLAQIYGSELHLVHAWWFYAEATLRGPRIQMPKEEVDSLVNETREIAQQNLEDMLRRVDLAGVPHEVELIQGHPVEVLSELTAQSDVVVMGTVSRSGAAGILIGNTAESVLRRLDCSVLAVKPRGFRTPLRF